MELSNVSLLLFVVIGVLIVFMVVIKAYALWLAARRREKGWYIALFIIQSLAILDIIYIFFIAKNSETKASASVPPTPAPPRVG